MRRTEVNTLVPADVLDAVRRRFGRWVGVCILLLIPLLLPTYYVSVGTKILTLAMLAMSLDLVLGYVGLASFGHAAFFGVGAYAAALISRHAGSFFLFSLAGGVLAAALAALVIGLLALRTQGLAFMMITLALSQMVYSVADSFNTNGLAGIPRPSVGFEFIDAALRTSTGYYVMAALFFLLCWWLLQRLIDAPFGRILVGIRENEWRMRAIGCNTHAYRLAAFVISGAFGGAAGVIYAQTNGSVSPQDLYWLQSAETLIVVLVGGVGTLIGSLYGAAFFTVMMLIVGSWTDKWQLITGLVLVVMVYLEPKGFVGLYRRFVPLLPPDSTPETSDGASCARTTRSVSGAESIRPASPRSSLPG